MGSAGPERGLKKSFSVAPGPRVRQTYYLHPNSVRRGQNVLLQRVTFFYRACAGFARWVSQRTPAGQIWVVRPVAVGHRRYARWGRASAARAPPPSPPRSPSQAPQPAVQASRVAVGPGKGLTSMLAPHEAHAAEACQNIPALPVLTNHPYLLNNTSMRPGRRLFAWIRVF